MRLIKNIVLFGILAWLLFHVVQLRHKNNQRNKQPKRSLMPLAEELKSLFDSAKSLPPQQGYQPDTPALFSHKIHAGTLKMDCLTCHVKVEDPPKLVSMSNCARCHYYLEKPFEHLTDLERQKAIIRVIHENSK